MCGRKVKEHMRKDNFSAILDFCSEEMVDFGELILDNCRVGNGLGENEQKVIVVGEINK